mmetsp:Transcript_32670/g.50823  ORF Transcript_32670/g.50823 Transcript_32670/m.50823 type:complete len:808 (+) Transcript_32670:194-2617(+)
MSATEPSREKRRFEERDRRRDREERPRRRSRSRRKEEDAVAVRKSPSRSRSAPKKASAAIVAAGNRRSGFDQKDMLPENFAIMQLAAMKTPPPQMQQQRGPMIGMPPPNMVPNPEVELFLQHNPVEPHAATRLRSLPMELQTIVLQRGSLFGGRDPTAVLLGRIRSATSGLRGSPQAGMYGGGAGGFVQGPAGGFSGSAGGFTGVQVNPMLPPGTGVVGMTPPTESAPSQSSQQRDRDRREDRQSEGSPWGKPGEQDDLDFGYGEDGSKSWYEAQAEKEKKNNNKNRPAGLGAGSIQSNNNSWNSGSHSANKDHYSKGNHQSDSRGCGGKGDYKDDGRGQQENMQLTPEMSAMRGKMQSSIAELSASLLGKQEAEKAGFVNEAGESAADASSGGVAQKRIAAKAPSLNPFRSKARVAPVAAEPEPQPLDPPVDFNKFQVAKPEPEPAELQQQEQQLKQQLQQHQEQQKIQEQQIQQQQQQHQQQQQQQQPPQPQDQPMQQYNEQDHTGSKGHWNSGQDGHVQAYSTAGVDIPMPPQQSFPSLPPPDAEPWTGETLATLNVPPGIAIRMIRQKRIVLTTNFLKQIEAFQSATISAVQDRAIVERTEGSSETPNGGVDEQMAAAAAAAEKLGASSGPELKRAQAIATLACYGLTDPTNSEDVAKAVQAVAVSTGDQATAVALWHQVNGTEQSEQSPQALTEEQQAEIQQAAASAQYSQYWLQQQFQSQLAMFENQRLMATGDNPVATVDDAKESAMKGPRGDPAVRGAKRMTNQPMLPGDWTCPGCGDHQFARNRVCRFCGASRPLGSH